MKREDKEVLVNRLHDELGKSHAVFITDYMGLNVEKMTQLRKSIRDAGGRYQGVKTTLLSRAAKETPVAMLDASFSGPTAIAIALNDPVSIAKALVNFAKENEQLGLQGGVLGGKILDENGIQSLAKMPPKEVLLAKMLGSLNAPVSNFVGVFAALLRQLVYVLKAVEEQKRQGE